MMKSIIKQHETVLGWLLRLSIWLLCCSQYKSMGFILESYCLTLCIIYDQTNKHDYWLNVTSPN